MAGQILGGAELLTAVPVEVRQRLVSGMRWTFWLSALAAPLSYGTTFLLARAGAEALGTYGLLSVYLGLLSSFFYLGGDAVAIRFIPAVKPEERISFLSSYFLVISALFVPWLVFAAAWPERLGFLFGAGGACPFRRFLLWLTPVYLLFSLILAALKGALEIRSAQTLLRVVTLGFFFAVAFLFLLRREWLQAHPAEVIWGTYSGLVALATLLAAGRLLWLVRGWGSLRQSRFLLPDGFWRFTLSLQQMSLVRFFILRLDYLLILNFGGLGVLGKYVGLLTVATVIQVATGFFLDTLLPALTNLMASGNDPATAQVISLYMRLLFAFSALATCGLVSFAVPIAALLGPEYTQDAFLLAMLALFVGLSAPASAGGTFLTSVGAQQRAVWVSLGQVGLYTLLFALLWRRWELLGAVLAYGVSLVVSNGLLLAVAKRSVPIRFSVGRDYFHFALVAVVAAGVALSRRPMLFSPAEATLSWLAAVGLFFWLARYRIRDGVGLLSCFLPMRAGEIQAGAQR